MILVFLIAFSIITLVLLSVCSVSIFMIGRRRYFLQLKSLWNFKIDKIFVKSHNYSVNLHLNGSPVQIKNSTDDYYFFLNVKDDKTVIIAKILDSFYGSFLIDTYQKNDKEEWITDSFRIDPNSCVITHLLKDRVESKLRKCRSNSDRIERIEDIDHFLNDRIKSICREKKLKRLLK